MSRIRVIRTEADYNAALARIGTLMDAEPDTPDGEELDVLTDLVELYEARHEPMGYPQTTPKFSFGQPVALKYDFDDMPAGTIGTVVHVYEKGGCYEVEFTTPSACAP